MFISMKNIHIGNVWDSTDYETNQMEADPIAKEAKERGS